MVEVATETIATLAEIRTFLNLPEDETGPDNLIVAIANGLNKRMERYLKTALIAASFTEYHDGAGTNTIYTRKCPLQAVTSITEDGTTIPLANVTIDYEAGIIINENGEFAKGNQNIVIVYSAGIAASRSAIPDDLKLALKLWVTYVYKGLTDFSTRLEESNLVTITGKAMPEDIKEILDDYKNRIVTYGGI